MLQVDSVAFAFGREMSLVFPEPPTFVPSTTRNQATRGRHVLDRPLLDSKYEIWRVEGTMIVRPKIAAVWAGMLHHIHPPTMSIGSWRVWFLDQGP